jgi:ABC-2 type transport system ATP-binding protein
LIKVENLTKRYAMMTAVNNISFEVAEREVLGFLGPNGAGKSTTLRILTGYLSATSGQVKVAGHDVFSHPEAVKKIMGYLPENVPLYGELRVREYLKYRAELKKVPASKRARAVGEAIERCRIGDVQNRIIGQLSKGYRQRVGLADALVGDPQILILDEPTIGLDPNQIRQVRDLIEELGRERTVILSSHILPEVEAVCSRVQIMHKGRLIGQGKPDELRQKITDGGVTVTAEFKGALATNSESLESIEGVRSVSLLEDKEAGTTRATFQTARGQATREAVFELAVKNGDKLIGLAEESASLEDIFVEITMREEGLESEKGGAQ